MKRVQNMLLATAVALLLLPLTGGTAEAGWGHGRVTTNYSLPSVPAYATGYGPVVAAGYPVVSAGYAPAMGYSYSPVVVGRPTYAASPVVVRGLFGRPRFLAAGPVGVVAASPTVYASPAPVSAYYAPAYIAAPTYSAAPVSTYYAPSYSNAPVSTYYAPSYGSAPVNTYYAPAYSNSSPAPVSTYYAPSGSVVLPPFTIR